MKTLIVVSSVDGGLNRESLEMLQGSTYETVLDAHKVIYNSEDDFNDEHIQIMELSDFMEAWNNEEISSETWIGYIYIKQEESK